MFSCELGYSLCLSLYPDSQPEYPLCLGSAAELLSGMQQQSRQKHCLIRHWGWWPQPIFFLQNKPVSLLHTTSCETAEPLCGLFLVLASLQWRRPGVFRACEPSAVWKCHTWLQLCRVWTSLVVWTRKCAKGFSLFTQATDYLPISSAYIKEYSQQICVWA